MFYKKKLEESIKNINENNKGDIESKSNIGLDIEKSDVPAMFLAALITFLPVVIIISAGIYLILFLFLR